ncbi:hypothetical protein AYO38_06735 [bacterium SCGC AG-212-C10]|nr:hypothetical protein AYO38_06735 [bacterium SCGC AG-212-C10]
MEAVAVQSAALAEEPSMAGGLRPARRDGDSRKRALHRITAESGLAWVDGEDAGSHRLTITLAALAGESTWMTWLLDIPDQEDPDDVASIAAWLGQTLNAFRDRLEAAHAEQNRLGIESPHPTN